MARSRPASAFTLLELVVVVTLITLAIGWTTLDLQGVADRAALQTAAAQIAAIQRTVSQAASTSGMPRKLAWSPRGCTVYRPQWVESQWRWVAGPRFELVRRVELRNVTGVSPGVSGDSAGPPWGVTVSPGNITMDRDFELMTRHGVAGTVHLDGFWKTASLEMADTED